MRGLLLGALIVTACGGDGSSDTGYGANQPVPATKNCEELCARLADCVVALCNEDTDSDRYTGLEDLLALDCESTCTDGQVETYFTAEKWSCVYDSSCREVFDYQECDPTTTYHCD